MKTSIAYNFHSINSRNELEHIYLILKQSYHHGQSWTIMVIIIKIEMYKLIEIYGNDRMTDLFYVNSTGSIVS